MSDVPIRLLREMLQARTAATRSGECLDADTVAAWADEALSREERAAAEQHAADCPRCQALVAAMARATPPTAARSWWRAPIIGWLVPVAAAMAVLLLWTSEPRRVLAPSTAIGSNVIKQDAPRAARNTPPKAGPGEALSSP